jgi:hypothetical protein
MHGRPMATASREAHWRWPHRVLRGAGPHCYGTRRERRSRWCSPRVKLGGRVANFGRWRKEAAMKACPQWESSLECGRDGFTTEMSMREVRQVLGAIHRFRRGELNGWGRRNSSQQWAISTHTGYKQWAGETKGVALKRGPFRVAKGRRHLIALAAAGGMQRGGAASLGRQWRCWRMMKQRGGLGWAWWAKWPGGLGECCWADGGKRKRKRRKRAARDLGQIPLGPLEKWRKVLEFLCCRFEFELNL